MTAIARTVQSGILPIRNFSNATPVASAASPVRTQAVYVRSLARRVRSSANRVRASGACALCSSIDAKIRLLKVAEPCRLEFNSTAEHSAAPSRDNRDFGQQGHVFTPVLLFFYPLVAACGNRRQTVASHGCCWRGGRADDLVMGFAKLRHRTSETGVTWCPTRRHHRTGTSFDSPRA